MNAEVVDASALAALLFGEPEAARVAEQLEGARLFAPSLIRYELASVCRKKLRGYPAQQASILAAVDLYPRLAVVEAEVPLVELVGMSGSAGVTAYDAAYLWVARHTETPLLTLDTELASAASRVGVSLVT